MNPFVTAKANRAFTMIELLAVMGIAVVLLLTAMPTHKGAKVNKSSQVQCMNNLRQIGLGVIMYAQDNKDLFPWQISTNQGGTEELISTGVAANHFAQLLSYLPATKVFVCPTDEARSAAPTNYAGFSNSNLSYFATLNTPFALTSNPPLIVLAGDRHLAFHQQPVKPGLFSITNPVAMSWTTELHAEADAKQTVGFLLFGDGRVTRTKTKELPEVLTKQALASTRLVIP